MNKSIMYVWLTILLCSGTVYAATDVTVSINTSSSTYPPSGVNLDGWEIWVRSTTFTSISDENIEKNDTDASGSAIFDLDDGSYFVGAVYFNKSLGELYSPTYMGVYTNELNNSELGILDVSGSNTTINIGNFSQAGAVRGYVTNTSGNGINDAEVTVVDSDILYPITTRMFNDKDGYYSIFLSPGTYTLEIEKSGYVTKNKIVTVTQGYGSTGSEFVNVTLIQPVTEEFPADEPQEIDDFEEVFGISLNITTTSDLNATINLTVTDNADELGASAYSILGPDSRLIGNYFEIEVTDNINSTSGNLTNVTLIQYYSDDDLQDGVTEDSLKLYWYNSSGNEWKQLVDGANYSSSGGPTVFATGQDISANYIWVTLDHFSIFTLIGTVSAQPASDTDGDDSGGGGGGTPTSFEVWTKNVQAGKTFELDVDDEDVSYINGIYLIAKQDIYSSKLSITDLDKKPWSSMEEPDTSGVYRYFRVSYTKNTYVESAKLRFSVSKSWLEDNDIDPYSVSMYRYTNAWEELDTKILDEDDENIYFEAIAPGFSYFSIGGEIDSGYKSLVEEEEEKVSSPTPVEEETETVEPPEAETYTPAPPVETPEPEQEPVKAPEGEENGGICGPTTILLIMVLSLLAIRGRYNKR